MPGNRLKTMFGPFIVCDDSVETNMCDWWRIDSKRVSKLFSCNLWRDRKCAFATDSNPYNFRLLSRAKISLFSLCDTHLIKLFGKKAYQAREYLPKGKSRNARFNSALSILSYPGACPSKWLIFKLRLSSTSYT